MKSKTSCRRLIGLPLVSIPVVLCLLLGVTGCASGSRYSVTRLWRKKPAETTAKKETTKDSDKKSGISKSVSGFKKTPDSKTSKEVAKSDSSKPKSDSADDQETVTSQASRRDRLRAYLKNEDSQKSDIAKSPELTKEKDSIRQVSKSETEDDSLLSSLPGRKRPAATDPFLDDEDPIEAATKLKSKKPTTASRKSLDELDPEAEPADDLSDLDREMAASGMKKRKTEDVESINRLESLLQDAEEEIPTTKKQVATKSLSSDNPFEDLDAEEPVVTKPSKPVKKVPAPVLDDEPETKTASIEEEAQEEFAELSSKPTKAPPAVAKQQPASDSPRARADDLILQALAMMRKNEFDEACSLAEAAAKLESDHELEYGPGEESPSKLLSQLNQLRGMMAQDDTPAPKKKTASPEINPNPISLPSLSDDLQPIDDETAHLSEHSATQRVSYTTEYDPESEAEDLTTTASAAEAEPQIEVVEKTSEPIVKKAKGPAVAASANPFEDLENPHVANTENEGPIFADTTVDPTETKASAGITTFAPSVSDSESTSKQPRKSANDSLGMLLIGISLLSLGCAGVFVWRAMRPIGNAPAAPVARQTQSETTSKKAA